MRTSDLDHVVWINVPVTSSLSPQMESLLSAPAPPPPPLHLLTPGPISDISSPCEQIIVRTRSVAVNTADAALATEPECLGPCEPGTSVNLEGIVWQETEDGKTDTASTQVEISDQITFSSIDRTLEVFIYCIVIQEQIRN